MQRCAYARSDEQKHTMANFSDTAAASLASEAARIVAFAIAATTSTTITHNARFYYYFENKDWPVFWKPCQRSDNDYDNR
jgi:hypothetical protein